MKRRRKVPRKWIVILILITVVICYIIFDSAIRPAVFSLAEVKVKAVAIRAINDVTSEVFGSGYSYSDLVTIEKDETGNITSLSANPANINNLSSEITVMILDKISNAGVQGISIPLGTLIGGQLFSGSGPPIQIKFEPAGSVNTEFLTGFESAGINQTRHKIFVEISVSIRIIVGNVVQSIDTSSEVLIADTIVVGKIPDKYMQFGNSSDLQGLAPMLLLDQYTDEGAQ